jgi:flavin-binding protein dodecin
MSHCLAKTRFPGRATAIGLIASCRRSWWFHPPIAERDRNGLARAAKTTRGLDWFEVQSVRGHLENGAVAHFQVTLKVGFRLEDA